jgi:thiamine biosynthesis protein ThiI
MVDMVNTKEILLLKYGEIALKGLNKITFERALTRTLEQQLSKYGNFEIYRAQSTIYAEPKEDGCDMEGATAAAAKIFGIATVCRAISVEKDMDKIKEAALAYLPRFLEGKKSFKVECKRSDKHFPLTSPQIAAEVGGVLFERFGNIAVDLRNPEITIRVEIRDFAAYIHAGRIKGAGGIPVGTGGKGLLLLSGGIDSPAAGYMMAKRGLEIGAIHFESFPYTGERAREKALTLASILSEWCGDIDVRVVSLTKIQEAISRSCDEEYFTLLLRRSMMRIAERLARQTGCGALITGESLGQVASQTMQALAVTDSATDMLVLRPCIGMDKEEIVTLARKIGTFETSILPYEDCCTVFTPRHPKTKPNIHRVLEEESKYDCAALEDEAAMF